MTNCPNVPLPDLLSFIVDNRGKTVPTSESGHVLIATNCVRNEYLYPIFEKIRFLSEKTYQTWFRAHPKPGDIIFVNKGTPGRVCMVPNPVNFCIAQDMMSFRVNTEKLYNKYLLAVLRSEEIQTQIYNYSVGDVIPHFKKSFLGELLIPLPDMDVQIAIGDIYFSMSEKMNLNTKINNHLEQMAQAIFTQTLSHRNNTIVPIGDFIDVRDGTHDSPKVVEQGFPLVTSKHLLPYGVDTVSPNRISKTDFDKINERSKVDQHDILISMIGTIGLISLVIERDIKFAIKNVGLFKTSQAENWIYFVLCFLRSPETKSYIDTRLAGSTQKYISLGELRQLPVAIPSPDDLQGFNETVCPLFDEITRRTEESAHLAALRDTLLPRLMSGELSIPNPGDNS